MPTAKAQVDMRKVDEIVAHVKKMQEKYEFQSDEDSVRDSVEKSAAMMRIEMTEAEVVSACDKILGH